MIPGKTAYDSLPIWAQTLAVNLVSRRKFREKYGAFFHESLLRLERNERASLDQLLEEQQAAVRRMLEYAGRHVPYYRRGGFPPDDLSSWPILEKSVVAARTQEFLSDEFVPKALLKLKTSGTTGTPLAVFITYEYHQMEMAFRWRHKAWGGVPYLSRGAYVSGHPVVPPGQKEPPFWRMDHFEKRLLCSSYHFTPQNLGTYIKALADFRPDFVHGYPSSLYLLAREIVDHGGSPIRPRAVFTASETLLDFQREAIGQAFGAPVFNWYGNTEMTCNIVQCAAGGLHYRMDYGLLDLLDDGTMVCTGLNNRAMPLIRYRVGDTATMQKGSCPCGCAFPLIERIEGRMEDYVQTPDGRRVGRLDHLFKDARHVREAQIIQKQLDEIVIRVVRDRGFSPHDEVVIRAEAQLRLGASIRVRFEYVERIDRTANGKFRFVVSHVPRPSSPTVSSAVGIDKS
jgi:phenylacetate-CoA ligase